MIVYNVTIKVNQAVSNAWLNWLKEEHIPDIISTGCFTHAVIMQLLDTDETDGLTFAIQYHAKNKMLYTKYINNFAAAMRQKAFDKWGDNFIAFRTVMHIIT